MVEATAAALKSDWLPSGIGAFDGYQLSNPVATSASVDRQMLFGSPEIWRCMEKRRVRPTGDSVKERTLHLTG
jgi:hypothetical protein